jgi:hypothetical protein
MHSWLTSLPDEVLTLVMQHVPVWHRLNNCSLVCSRLHAAAAVATDCLQFDFTEDNESCRINETTTEHWLSKYGQHLTSLSVRGMRRARRDLPCSNLQELQLTDCTVQLAAEADGYPGVIQGCTKLTRLYLCSEIIGAPEGAVVDGLSSLVHLQYLWVHPSMLSADGAVRYMCGGLPDGTLICLQHLTSLSVRGFSVENLMHLGCLTSLQRLELDTVDDTVIGPSTFPGLALPASLKALLLYTPVDAEILSLVPAALQELWVVRPVHGPAEGPKSFLSCMARLQHLTKLVVLQRGGLAWPPPGPAYSALTASSSLVHLEICNQDLPHGVWPFMFPAARKLPHLTRLVLRELARVDVPDFSSPSWGSADLRNLVSCCPSLCEIEPLFLQHGLHALELQKLTSLASLQVYYAAPTQAMLQGYHMTCTLDGLKACSMEGLALVTQLRCLHVRTTQEWEASKLVHLANLTNLTRFMLTVHNSEEDQYGEVEPRLEYYTWQVSLAHVSSQDCDVHWLSWVTACLHHCVCSLRAAHHQEKLCWYCAPICPQCCTVGLVGADASLGSC